MTGATQRARWPAAEGEKVLRNFCYVIDGVLAGCAHPDSFGDLEQALHELHEQGIGALVSLDEQGLAPHTVAEFGLHYLHLPVPDFGVPTLEQVRQFVAFVDRERALGRAVAVHCRAGFGRTGTMIACYLVAAGHEPAQAIAIVRSRRPGSIETTDQERFVETFWQFWRTQQARGDAPA